MNRARLKRIIPITLLFITIFSIQLHSKIPLESFLVSSIIQALILLMFWIAKRKFYNKKQWREFKFVQWYIAYNIICILRGCFIAENYWDWKGLATNTLALLIPIITYACSNLEIVPLLMKGYLKYALPLFVFFAFIITKDAYGFYLVPISFLMLFFPTVGSNWKVALIGLTILVVFADLSARSNVIKFVVPVMLLAIYYFKQILPVPLMKLASNLMMITPFVLFFLACTIKFNVLQTDNNIKETLVQVNRDTGERSKDEDLKSDTRTPLYIEVLHSAQKYNYWVFGRSPARGNETVLFSDLVRISGRRERLENEVAILNILTWTGITGVILYMLVFYRAAYLAISKSNNIFSKILGLYVSFRWMYAWVEDPGDFTLTTFFLWITIALCLSSSFRILSDREVKYWVGGMFGKIKKANHSTLHRAQIIP